MKKLYRELIKETKFITTAHKKKEIRGWPWPTLVYDARLAYLSYGLFNGLTQNQIEPHTHIKGDEKQEKQLTNRLIEFKKKLDLLQPMFEEVNNSLSLSEDKELAYKLMFQLLRETTINLEVSIEDEAIKMKINLIYSFVILSIKNGTIRIESKNLRYKDQNFLKSMFNYQGDEWKEASLLVKPNEKFPYFGFQSVLSSFVYSSSQKVLEQSLAKLSNVTILERK